MDPISPSMSRPSLEAQKKDEVSKAAREFEAAFLGMVVNEMMKDTMPDTMNGGQGEEMFRSLLGNEIGKQIAESGGVGISETVEKQMRAYQK